MKFKNIIMVAVAALALFAVAGTSSAQITSDINVYGASAQFIVWRDNAAAFMASQGCTDIASAQLYVGGAPDGRNAITRGTCGGTVRYFRTSAKASYDGILAIQGNTTNPFRVTECTSPFQRRMIDEATCNWATGQCSATRCMNVTVGASDVPVQCFTQESHGNLRGPLGGSWTDRNFKTNPISWTGAEPCKPMAVPFAFFVNKSVTKLGNTITNITKDNAELIFSGQIQDWSDMVDSDGTSYDAKPIAVCMRHAGSGTQAAIDGYLESPMITVQDSASTYKYYFNDGSTDMMRCVNGSGSWSGAGAIGYADADQILTSYPNTTQIALNGVVASAGAIAGGNYNFYSLQHLYGITDGSPLCAFAKNPANIANPLWVAKCKMVYERARPCDAFPLQWTGVACP